LLRFYRLTRISTPSTVSPNAMLNMLCYLFLSREVKAFPDEKQPHLTW